MSVGPFDPDLEREMLEEKQAHDSVVAAARAEYTPERVAELERIALDFPWMPADAADALVSSGLTAGDEATRLAAGAALAEGQVNGLIGGRPLSRKQLAQLGEITRRPHRSVGPSASEDDGSEEDEASEESSDDGGLWSGVGGFLGNAKGKLGTAASTVGNVSGMVLNQATETLFGEEGSFGREQVVKPFVRGALIPLEYPVQLSHGAVSQMHDAVVHDGWAKGLLASGRLAGELATPGITSDAELSTHTQTDLGAALVEGSETGAFPDLGQGFFVGEESAVGQRRRTERLKYETIVDGEPFTIGHLAAGSITEPGTKPFGVISGLTNVALEIAGPGAVFDPIFLGPKAARGAVVGTASPRRAISAENVETFMGSEDGIRVVNRLVEEDSFVAVDRSLGGAADPRVVEAIRVSRDADEVGHLIRSQVGIEVTTAPTAPVRGEQFVRDTARDTLPSWARVADNVPQNYLSITDARQRVNTTRRYLSNSGASADEINYFLPKMATATSPGAVRIVAQEMAESIAVRAWEGSSKHPGGSVAGLSLADRLKGAPPEVLMVARFWSREIEETRAFWVQAAETGDTGYFHMDFWGENAPTPQSITELLNTNIPLPDYRAMREVFASPAFETLMKIPGGAQLHHIADLGAGSLMSVWKAGRLLRLAWPIKVLSEGQMRLTSFGYSSLGNNVWDYLSHIVGSAKSRRGSTDAMGSFMNVSDEMQEAMFVTSDVTRIGAAQQRIYTNNFVVIRNPVYKDATEMAQAGEFARQYADVFERISSDGVLQMYLTKGTFDEAAETFWNNMPGTRAALQRGRPSDTRDIVNIRADADSYLRDNIVARMEHMAQGNTELLDAFRTRSLDGHPVKIGDRTTINPKFIEAVEARIDSLPEYIHGRQVVMGGDRPGLIRDGVNSMFSWLMSIPSNRLERSPLFRMQYWRSMERLALHMDPSEAAMLSRNADAASLGRKQKQSIDDRAGRPPANPNRMLSLEEADSIAKSDGLRAVKEVLYDASERNNFFDIWRHVFPFGDAFVEVMSRWAKIFAQNPNRIRKTVGVVEETEGWFSENQYGDEVFNVPLSGTVMAALGVDRMGLTSYQAGLSMMMTMTPGAGPVGQIPVAMVLPDDEEWGRNLREMVSQGFGLPPALFDIDFTALWSDDKDISDVVALGPGMKDLAGFGVEVMSPPWVNRLLESAGGLTETQKRLYSNLVGDIALSKIANDPDYSLAMSDEELSDLLAESRRDATVAFFLRAAAAWTVPGAPTFEMKTDVTGEELAQWVVEDEYRRMAEEVGHRQAALDFIEAYGYDAQALHQPASIDTSSGGGSPLHRDGLIWVGANEFAKDAYPHVYGFFAPPASGEADDFDYAEYLRQFADGDRESLSPRQRVEAMQGYVARIRYAQERDWVIAQSDDGSISEAYRDYLRSERARLEEMYPGYLGIAGMPEAVPNERQIAQLEEALDDPRLADNPLIEPLSRYFVEREWANGEASGQTFNTGHGDDTWLRAYMYREGVRLADESVQFAEVWERVLYREFSYEHEKDLEGQN